jgi:hypothetical protein
MARLFKIAFFHLFVFQMSWAVFAQESNAAFSEGPHIFLQEGQWIAKWVENGEMKSEENITEEFLQKEFQLGLKPYVFTDNFENKPDTKQNYKDVSKIVVISDPHGQFDLMVQLLKSHGVIDDNLDWRYGNGHLVVNGDIMGRGDGVTEILWLVYKLEHQAKRQKGRVHFLIGNHELMTMLNDLRYLNGKYQQAADIMGISVAEMYGANSVFGNWLRKLPAMITINDLLIVHAGVSKELVERKMTVSKVNKIFFDQISGFKPANKRQLEEVEFLIGSQGPIWYRGYFLEGEVYANDIDDILKYFKSNKIIVGHTSLRVVSQLFGGRVMAVDSNIKEGVNGEILIIEEGVHYRGNPDGVRFKMP